MAFWTSVLGQFSTLPYPDQDCTGKTVIVTGANVGLGLEAARHFVRLNAGKVVLACRSVDKGEAARRDIESTTQKRGVVEVWQLDLSSFDSVRDFAARAAGLARLDVLLNNASLLSVDWAVADEGHEVMVAVNVLSTFLLTIKLLPLMRQTAAKCNVTPHVVIVSSDGAFMSFFPEKKAGHIFNRLKVNQNYTERYNTTKLLQLMLMRRLAAAMDASSSKDGRDRQDSSSPVIVNALNPGFCNTQLFRAVPFPFNVFFGPALALFARSSEMGSRTLMAAAFAGDDTHGHWMTNCRLHGWPAAMKGDDAEWVMDKLWGELTEVLEGIEPGVMKNI